jgi:hypothetical protein
MYVCMYVCIITCKLLADGVQHLVEHIGPLSRERLVRPEKSIAVAVAAVSVEALLVRAAYSRVVHAHGIVPTYIHRCNAV